jgi:hypothetical protein
MEQAHTFFFNAINNNRSRRAMEEEMEIISKN